MDTFSIILMLSVGARRIPGGLRRARSSIAPSARLSAAASSSRRVTVTPYAHVTVSAAHVHFSITGRCVNIRPRQRSNFKRCLGRRFIATVRWSERAESSRAALLTWRNLASGTVADCETRRSPILPRQMSEKDVPLWPPYIVTDARSAWL